MKCPHCSHVSEAPLLKCSSCGEIYDRKKLDELHNVIYLLEWLDKQRSVLGTAADRLFEEEAARRDALRAALLPRPAEAKPEVLLQPDEMERLAILYALKSRLNSWILSDAISIPSAHELREQINRTLEEAYPGVTQKVLPTLPDARSSDVDQFLLENLDSWLTQGLLSADEVRNLRLRYGGETPVEVSIKPERDLEAGLSKEQVGLSADQLKRLALLLAAKERISGWIRDCGLSSKVTPALEELLRNLILAVHPEAESGRVKSFLPAVSEEEIRAFVIARLGTWVGDSYLTATDAKTFGEYLRMKPAVERPIPEAPSKLTPGPVVAAESRPVEQARVHIPDAPPVPPRPAVAPKPKEPPKPREPLIQWDKVWANVVEAAVSGLLLRWLRYLGAFLFVVSAAIVVVNFWNEIPQVGQVAIIFFVPTAFYAGGLILRRNLGVVQTGGVLMGVGQILLAIDFAAIYQFGGLTVDPRTYWLITSVICTVFYLFTVFFVAQAEFFGYIGLLGVGSTLAAGVAMATVSLEWPLVAGAAVAALSVEWGHWLQGKSEKWQEIAESGLRFPQFAIPMILLLLLLLPTPDIRWAQAAGFAVATLAAGLLALRVGQVLYTHAAVWFSALTSVMILRGLSLDWTWYPTAAGGLALLYTAVIPLMRRGSEEVIERRKPHLMPFEVGALALLFLAVISGAAAAIFDLWAGIISLALAVAVMVVKSLTDQKPAYLAAASVIFFVPLSLAVLDWMGAVEGRPAWLLGVWIGMAFVYMAISAVLRRQDIYVRWMVLPAQAAVLVSLAGLAFFPLIGVSTPWNVLTIVLGEVVLFYVFSAVLHHSGEHPAIYDWVEQFIPPALRPGIFAWVFAILLPVWLAVFWQSTILQPAWLAVGMAGLGLAYAGVSPVAGKLKRDYTAPFRLLPYPIALFGVLPAVGDSLPLMVALFIDTVSFALLAFLYHMWIETAFAGFVLLLPFTLAMDRLNIDRQAFSIGYMALVSFAYIPLAEALFRRRKSEYHHVPLRIIGYGMSVAAVYLSILGAFRMFGFDILWIGVVVPAAAALLYGYSAFRVHRWFAWAAVAVLPLAFWQGLLMLQVQPAWQAGAWVGFGMVYLVAGALVKRHAAWQERMSLPVNVGAWLMAALGLALTLPFTATALLRGSLYVESGLFAAPVTAHWLAAGFVVLAAILYRSRLPLLLEPWLAFLPATLMLVGYGESWFGRFISSGEFAILWAAIGMAHLLAAAILDHVSLGRGDGRGIAGGIYLGAYAQIFLAVAWSPGTGHPFLWAFGLMIVAGAGSAFLVHTRRHLAWAELRKKLFGKRQESIALKIYNSLFIWLAAWALPVWVAEFLRQLPVLPGYEWLGYVGSALALFALALLLQRVERSYTWPLYLAGHAFTAFTWLASLPFTFEVLARGAVIGKDETTGIAILLVQMLSVVFYALFVVLNRRNSLGYAFSFVAAALAVLPYTLLLQLFGRPLVGRILHPVDFGVAWILLSGLLIALAVWIEQHREMQPENRLIRFDAFSAHGLYLVGYGLADLAFIWALSRWFQQYMGAIILTMGGWILLMAVSARVVHVGWHRTWEDLMRVLFGRSTGVAAAAVRSTFLWLTAWTLPVWVVLVLWQFGVLPAFGYLGYSMTAAAFLVLAVLLGRVRREYAWPLVASGQFYNLLALVLSMPAAGLLFEPNRIPELLPERTLSLSGLIAVQAAAMAYFGGSAAYFRRNRWVARWFSYLASHLAWLPVTLGAVVIFFRGIEFRLAYVWLGLGLVLLAAGYALDAIERRSRAGRRTAFAHGAYLSGYLGLFWSLFWVWPDRTTWLISTGALLLILIVSQWTVHARRHDTWEDMLGFFFNRAEDTLKGGARSAFLWGAAVLFPIWLTALLAYQDVPMAWRGLALALAAPVYVACGLVLRRVDGAYSLPLYVTGYLLTAVGAMISFDNLILAIYVLALDAVVYAVSAYIFRQPIWLYLTTVLAPVIGVMTLQYNLNALPAEWLTAIFMGLAYIYMAVGQAFDRRRVPGEGVPAFALPFYAPAFLLSALGLATASGDRELAVIAYLAGVVIYSFSAWRFREPVFLYPAAWLAAVPYYLGMTYTNLDPNWYGIGWLPLIAAAFLLGRRVFHRHRDRLTLVHPAMPFYILVYSLSLSMILIAQSEMLALSVSLTAAGILYLYSAWEFRKAFWLYPGLFAGHLALAAFTQVDPSGRPIHLLAVVFLPVTALVTILGAWLWKHSARLEGRGWKQVALDWAAPFLFFGALDLAGWQIVAAFSPDSGVIVAGVHAVIVGVVAVLWLSQPVVWGSLAFLVLAMAFRLAALRLILPASGAVLAGTGFGVYLIGRLLAELAGRLSQPGSGETLHPAFRLWAGPVALLGIGLNVAGLAAAAVFVFSETSLTAITLVFAGGVGLAEAYRRRWYILGYISVAVLEFAYVLLMLDVEISQLQWYAVPAGLYLVGVAFFERRRGRTEFAALLESLGLVVMLLTSFGQSLDVEEGFWYFLLMLVEAILIIAWAAQQQRKIPFLIGAAGSVANVIGQVVIVFLGGERLIKWLIFGGVGLAILMAAIFAERWIIPRAKEMRERLEAWA